MFSGLVQNTSRLVKTSKRPGGDKIFITKPKDWKKLKMGESISISGMCLSLKKFDTKTMAFDRSSETIERTILHPYVNLERALKIGDPLGGHIVQGHVDGLVELEKIIPKGEYQIWKLKLSSKKYGAYLVEKGSITLEGVSLTVSKLVSKRRFQVALIPLTLQNTSLKYFKCQDFLNFEIDIMAKYCVQAQRSQCH